ncbi:Protein OS-9 [Coemansia sp. RSA 2611]|nr:Protein OS-9 [Coemansia sp. RSA 2611]
MEDMHETPRFQIKMLDELIPDSELDSVLSRLKALAQAAERKQAARSQNHQQTESLSRDSDDTNTDTLALDSTATVTNASELIYDPIVANAGHKWKFLCQMPRVDPHTPTATEDTKTERDETGEQQEEEQAIARGLGLLQPLTRNCITYTTGWWTFEYCHDRLVRQYHRMAPDKHGHVAEIEYRLGEYSQRKRLPTLDDSDSSDARADAGSELSQTTQIRQNGRKRFLTQLWAGGTLCDITRQPREVEVQFHCDPNSPERIALVEEVAICQYVVVINTPRLCADPSFFDTAASTVYDIKCQQVVPDSDFKALMAEREQLLHLESEQAEPNAEEASQDTESDENDDNVPLLALAGRRKLPPKYFQPAGSAAADKDAKPQIVVSLNDPALAKAARQNQEMVRRLLALAYGDMKLQVEFTDDTTQKMAESTEPDAEQPPTEEAKRPVHIHKEL